MPRDAGADGLGSAGGRSAPDGAYAEFAGDPNALAALRDAKYHGTSLEYVVQGLRRKRTEATEQKRVRDEFAAAGVTIAGERPFGGAPLSDLRTGDGDDGEQLTPENRKDCPGRSACFRPFQPTEPVHFCADPEAYGHSYRDSRTAKLMKRRVELLAEGRTVTGEVPASATTVNNLLHDGEPLVLDTHKTCPGSGVCLRTWGDQEVEYCLGYEQHGHTLRPTAASSSSKPDVLPPKKVREGNVAWIDAAAARRDWLKGLFARPKVTKAVASQITAFVTEHMVDMPAPAREALTGMWSQDLFTKFTGRTTDNALKEIPRLQDGRRLLLALARIAAAYEYQMAGGGDRKKTWRLDTGNYHCSRAAAGHYLQFLIELGHKPSPIEAAVAQAAPYTGDTPPSPGGSQDHRRLHHRTPARRGQGQPAPGGAQGVPQDRQEPVQAAVGRTPSPGRPDAPARRSAGGR